jgi:SnoaL-like domain
MSGDLPKPVAAYFAADKVDGEAVARCFTDDGVVEDEGHTYSGLAEINRWKAEASKKYSYTSEPFACDQKGAMTIVTSRLTGSFPGSPVDLRYFFRLRGEKIASLEIAP